MVLASEHPLADIDENKKYICKCGEEGCEQKKEGFRCTGFTTPNTCPECGRWTNELYLEITESINPSYERYSQLQNFGYCPWCDVVFSKDGVLKVEKKQKWFKNQE